MRIPVLRSPALLALVAGLSLFMWTSTTWAQGNEGVDVNAQFTSLDRTVISVQVHDYASETVRVNGQNYTRISLEGEGIVQRERPGFPSLPAIYRSLMLPDAARMQIHILKEEYHEIHDIDLISNKGTILRNVDPSTVPYTFNEVYETDGFYPGDLTLNRDPYIMRNVRGMVVEIYPFQYNPVQRTLRVYHELEIEVVATAESGINVLNRTANAYKPDRSFFEMQQRHFINSAAVRTEPPSEDGDLLIISNAAFLTAMQPLVDWKNASGINTTLVDVATVGNNSTAILNYVTNLYNQGNLAFVLLVGDSTEVVSGSYGSGLSDAYYSTITSDWYPDLFVGRFSASTVAQAQTQVERTVAYEQAGHNISMGGWNAAALGVASDQGSGIGHYGEADYVHMNLIRAELLAYGFTTVDGIYDPSGTAAQVSTSLNAGRRVVNYCGHGSTTSWGSTGFSNTNVNNLTNVGKLPFIHSVACVNGAFGGTTCFAEAWLRATSGTSPTGAVGCYMSTVNQSWEPPMYAQGNHSKSGKYGSAERFWMEMHSTLGGIWYGGSCCMMDLAGSTGRSEFMNWVIFGDPSLRLREATPPVMSLSFPNGVPSGLYPPGPEMPVTIEIKPGTENYVPGSGFVHYRFDAGSAFTPVAVSALGGYLYEAVIPNTSPGDQPEFYFSADTDGGTTLYAPANAPSS
ncbi:MAG: C25 family cysteine peptidase, partial [Planctomycetota bacterium]